MNSVTTRNTDVYAKRHSIISHYIYPFASAFVKGFYGFLKMFSFILILEIIRFSTGIVEDFHFDLIDVLISLIGFIYSSFAEFSNGLKSDYL